MLPAINSTTWREHEHLTTLRTSISRDLAGTMPVPIAAFDWRGHAVAVQSLLDGPTLERVLRESRDAARPIAFFDVEFDHAKTGLFVFERDPLDVAGQGDRHAGNSSEAAASDQRTCGLSRAATLRVTGSLALPCLEARHAETKRIVRVGFFGAPPPKRVFGGRRGGGVEFALATAAAGVSGPTVTRRRP